MKIFHIYLLIYNLLLVLLEILITLQLWNSNGTIVPGNPLKLILPNTGLPHSGDNVITSYSFTINDISRVVVDYNKGDFFIRLYLFSR